jgi:hypothetical protein
MKYVKYLAFGALLMLGLLLFWGVAIEPRLIDRREEVAAIPNLPPTWEGRRVALIADFQVGMWLANTGTVRRIVGQLVEERPALVLIAGDFIYTPGEDPGDEIAAAADLVRPLTQAGIPTYAVLGNHDYAINWRDEPKVEAVAGQLRAALARAGVRVLHNEAIPLASPGGSTAPAGTGVLFLVGIGSRWAGEDEPRRPSARRRTGRRGSSSCTTPTRSRPCPRTPRPWPWPGIGTAGRCACPSCRAGPG